MIFIIIISLLIPSVISLFAIFNSIKRENKKIEEPNIPDLERKFRIVAFCKKSTNPSGLYTIEVKENGRWRRVNTFLYSIGHWNPFLGEYQYAKELASSWKNNEQKYNDWVQKQIDMEKSYKNNLLKKLNTLYPVDCEEV